ncbi:MAG: hypothetical protein C0485_00675 [Pirellula sp.]|nr:hypothetical protein [Pirellula sp.]
MTAGNANDDFDDELLSAYVDGELTAAEHALVEERLRSDPTAAALVDELRSLSSAIKSLPRETLGRDLRAGVLAEVEQARADLDSHGPAAQSHSTTLPLTPVDRWSGIRRGLVWSALAIAATVLIAVFQPAELAQDERELARAEKRQAAVAKADAEIEQLERRLRASDGVKEESGDQLAAAKDAAEAEGLPPGLRGSLGARGVDASVADEEEKSVESLAAVPATASAPQAAAPAATAVPMAATPGFPALKGETMDAESPAEEPAELDALVDSAANGQPSADAVALQDSFDRPGAALMAPLASSSEGASPAAAGAPTEWAMGGVGGGGAEGLRGGAMYRFDGQAGTADEARREFETPAATVTLRLATPEGALRFKTLLAESEIMPAEDVDRRQDFFGGRSLQFSRSAGGEQAAEEAKLDAADQAATPERSHYFFFSELKPEGADGAAATQLGGEVRSGEKRKESLENQVWVEATPAQLDALLLKCQDAEDAFAAVVVDDEAPLAKRAASAKSEMELKRLTLNEPQESPPQSSNAASEPRELVLFVLQPPNELPAAEAAPAK